jgi:dTMP kinase
MFITFEGIEGCGKTTQMKLAARWLEPLGYGVCTTREPGGSEIGAQIRKILLSENSSGMVPITEALLYMADRFQHIQEVILPALQEQKIVLCDRYHDSTIAYQGYARNISIELLDTIWEKSGSIVEPDLTFLFDLHPEIGLERSFKKLAAQQIDESRFENEAIQFHTRVREGFLQLLNKNSHRMVLIDADRSIDAVHESVLEILQERLKVRHEVE